IVKTSSVLGQEEVAEETAVTVTQVRQPSAQTVPQQGTVEQPAAPSQPQPSAVTIVKTTSALGQEEVAEETAVTVTQVRQPSAQAVPQQGIVEQPAAPSQPQSSVVEQPAAPSQPQPSAGTIVKTSSVLGQEEVAEETAVTVTQVRQPSAQTVPQQGTVEQPA
ncbi:unnamed protein product, partial [Adineta ricciae]